MNCACPEVGAVFAWRRAGYKREQFAQHCPEANFLREELVVPNCRETGRSLASSFRPCEIPFAPKLVRTPPNAAAAVRSYLSGQATRREHGAPATVSSRLLISALEKKTALPLPRSHRRRAAAASTAGPRARTQEDTRLPHLRYVRHCNERCRQCCIRSS